MTDQAKQYDVVIYPDAAGKWRWRVRHVNGNILADSGEGYERQGHAQEMVRRLFPHLAGGGQQEGPQLGLATTRELIAELGARAETGGYADYRTADS